MHLNPETGKPLSNEQIRDEPVVVQRLIKRVQELFQLLFVPSMKYRSKYCSQPVITSEMNSATTICKLMESMLKYDGGPQFNGTGVPREEIKNIQTHGQAIMFVERLFAFGLVWGVAGSISSIHRDEFDEYFSTLFEKTGCSNFLPGTGTSDTCYDYWLDPKVPDGSVGKGDFRKWIDVVPSFNYNVKSKFFIILQKPEAPQLIWNFLLHILPLIAYFKLIVLHWSFKYEMSNCRKRNRLCS